MLRNPLPGEPGSPYHPTVFPPRIHASRPADPGTVASSFWRDAEILDFVGAHADADTLRKTVEKHLKITFQ